MYKFKLLFLLGSINIEYDLTIGKRHIYELPANEKAEMNRVFSFFETNWIFAYTIFLGTKKTGKQHVSAGKCGSNRVD